MTNVYVFSFETKFSDANVPPASDMFVKNCQNSRSVSESGRLAARCASATLGAATHAIAPRSAMRAKRERAYGDTGPVSTANTACALRGTARPPDPTRPGAAASDRLRPRD